jgi:HrpA-like RNA helicase
MVIDFGKELELRYDHIKKIKTNTLQNITQTSAIQRAGRAGRTSQGLCYRLYS